MTTTKLTQVAKALQAKYGSGSVGRGDITPSEDRRITTGSLRLDAALGGGLRVGWVTSFYGEKSGGKSTTAIRCMGIAQNHCRNCLRPVKDVTSVPPEGVAPEDMASARWGAVGTCTCYAEGLYQPDPPPKETGESVKVYRERCEAWAEKLKTNSYEELVGAWIDMEHSFDKAWAVRLGLDTRRLLYVRPESAEESLDIMAGLIGTIEVDMLCIDSIANLTPTKELTDSMEQWQQGLQARLVNKGIRKLITGSSAVANEHRTITQIWINQVRDKITMFGDPTVKPGGKGQEFAVHAEVKFGKSKVETVGEQYGAKDEVVKIPVKETFSFKCTKNRTAGTKDSEGFYEQRMRDNETGKAGEILEGEEVFKLAMHYLVDQSKKGVYVLGDREYTSQKAIATDLNDDRDFFAMVRAALLAQLTKGSR